MNFMIQFVVVHIETVTSLNGDRGIMHKPISNQNFKFPCVKCERITWRIDMRV